MAGRFTNPNYQFFDDNGDPLAGGKLEFFASGTSTPQDTYSDDDLSVPNTNPVILNSAGRAGDVFLSSDDYKVVLKKSDDTVVWTADPVRSPSEKNTAVQDVSDATQLDSGDDGALIACNANAGGFVVSLPTAASAGNGYEISIIKVDGSVNIVTVDAAGSETINGNLDYQLLTQYATVTLRCDGSRWYVTAESVSRVNSPLDPDHIDGLLLSKGSTVASEVTVSSGSCRTDDDAANYVLSSSITKRINASFGEGNNQGGLDTGTVAADTSYDVYAIRKDDGTADVLFTVAGGSPSLPSGYTRKRRIGQCRTDGSSNLRPGFFVQVTIWGLSLDTEFEDIVSGTSYTFLDGLTDDFEEFDISLNLIETLSNNTLLIIQAGDTVTSPITTGYVSACSALAAAVATSSITIGFALTDAANYDAGNTYSGFMQLRKSRSQGDYDWHHINKGDKATSVIFTGHGRVTTSDRIVSMTLTTTTGAGTLDSGKIRIQAKKYN